jgi:hypothetical protein
MMINGRQNLLDSLTDMVHTAGFIEYSHLAHSVLIMMTLYLTAMEASESTQFETTNNETSTYEGDGSNISGTFARTNILGKY